MKCSSSTNDGVSQGLIRSVAYLLNFVMYHTSYGVPVSFIREILCICQSRTREVSRLFKLKSAIRCRNNALTHQAREELAKQDLCMVCREKRGIPDHNMGSANVFPRRNAETPMSLCITTEHWPQRLRCGQILHHGCLVTWIERQNSCPVCRRSVHGELNGAAA